MAKYNNTLEIKKRYRSLLRKDFSGIEPRAASKLVERTLGPLPHVNWPFNKSFGVVRARMVDEEREDISKLSIFGAPPSEFASLGRANLPGYPVFYGSFDGRTAMQEIKVPIGSKCFVSIWEFESDVPTVSAFLQHAEIKNDFSKIDLGRRKGFPSHLNRIYTPSSFYSAMKLRSLLFTGDNEAISARLSHDIIFDGYAKSDGVLYPSVIDQFRCNVALHPEFVSRHMRCVMILQQIWSGAFIFRTVARGFPDGAKVEWKKTGDWESDDIYRKYLGSFGPDEIHPNALKVLYDK